MIDDHSKLLSSTLLKLHHRGAKQNVQRILVKTHEADIAEVLKGFTPADRLAIFQLEPSLEKRASILSYFDSDIQSQLVQELQTPLVTKLVSRMDSDDAADLLGALDQDVSQKILDSMVKEESEEVVDLMAYPEDSAGGMMSSDFFAANQTLTVADTIKQIQVEQDDNMVLFYLYVHNDNDQLVGVLNLKQLLLSRPNDTLKELMSSDVITVDVEETQQNVAKLVERYDFLSVPVVDSSNKLVGVITVDDVIDVIREEAEEDLLAMGRVWTDLGASLPEQLRQRLPWQFLTFGASCGTFALIYLLAQRIGTQLELGMSWIVLAFIPMILALGGTVGSQSVTMSVGALRAGKYDYTQFGTYLKRELQLSIVCGLVFSSLVWLMGEMIFPQFRHSVNLGLALYAQVVFASIIGSFIPVGLTRTGFDPTVASVPLFTAIADVSAILVLFLGMQIISL